MINICVQSTWKHLSGWLQHKIWHMWLQLMDTDGFHAYISASFMRYSSHAALSGFPH